MRLARKKQLQHRRVRRSRRKISTTVSPENYDFLRQLASREATTLAEAVDAVVEAARRATDRTLLARQTEEYFANLSDEALAEENELGALLSEAAAETDYERR